MVKPTYSTLHLNPPPGTALAGSTIYIIDTDNSDLNINFLIALHNFYFNITTYFNKVYKC